MKNDFGTRRRDSDRKYTYYYFPDNPAPYIAQAIAGGITNIVASQSQL